MKSLLLSAACLLVATVSYSQVNLLIKNSTVCDMYVHMETENVQYACNSIDQDVQTVVANTIGSIATATGKYVSWIDAHAVSVGGGVAFHVCDGNYSQSSSDHCVSGMNIQVDYDEPNGIIIITEF